MFPNKNDSTAQVLIVGGGDGGVLREVCRHEAVTKVRATTEANLGVAYSWFVIVPTTRN